MHFTRFAESHGCPTRTVLSSVCVETSLDEIYLYVMLLFLWSMVMAVLLLVLEYVVRVFIMKNQAVAVPEWEGSGGERGFPMEFQTTRMGIGLNHSGIPAS